MHPGWLSSLPSGWRNLIVFVIAVLALSVILEKEFSEVARDELMFGKLEEAARDILCFSSEQPRTCAPWASGATRRCLRRMR